MKEVLEILDRAGGSVGRETLKHAVRRHTGGELTEELITSLAKRGLINCPNGEVQLTDLGAAAMVEAPHLKDDPPPQTPQPEPGPAPEPPEPEPAAPVEPEPSLPAPIVDNDADALEDRAQALKDQGLSYKAIAERLGVPRPDVGRLLSAAARRQRRPRKSARTAPAPKPDTPRETVKAAAAKARQNDLEREAKTETAPSAPPPPHAPELLERLRRRRADLQTQLSMLDEVLAELERAA